MQVRKCTQKFEINYSNIGIEERSHISLRVCTGMYLGAMIGRSLCTHDDDALYSDDDSEQSDFT